MVGLNRKGSCRVSNCNIIAEDLNVISDPWPIIPCPMCPRKWSALFWVIRIMWKELFGENFKHENSINHTVFLSLNFKVMILLWARQKGHKVTVLIGLPNYPEGKIYKGYGFLKEETREIEGVKVIRSLLILKEAGLFLNYFSWAFLLHWKLSFIIFEKFDALIVHEPSPITQGFPAIVVKKMQGTPFISGF
jgi:hypothetical protein